MRQSEIGAARVLQAVDLHKRRGKITCAGKTFELVFDDLFDLAHALEMIDLKLTGKMLLPRFRPQPKSREGITPDILVGGDGDLYDGNDAPASGYFMRIEIDGTRWDNWFTRMDELIRLLYVVIQEAQGDPWTPAPKSFLHLHA